MVCRRQPSAAAPLSAGYFLALARARRPMFYLLNQIPVLGIVTAEGDMLLCEPAKKGRASHTYFHYITLVAAIQRHGSNTCARTQFVKLGEARWIILLYQCPAMYSGHSIAHGWQITLPKWSSL